MTSTPGWFGKLPSLGDFASRRLPDTFISRWDTWLQLGMAESRTMLGERWMDVYLTSPIWRFALMPGVFEQGAWAGVMMPSVDKVGRHFPLTIAVEVASHAGGDAAWRMVGALDWFAAIEQVALSALDASRSAADFDDLVRANPFPAPMAEATGEPVLEGLIAWWKGSDTQPHAFEVPSEAAVASLLPSLGGHLLAASSTGKSVWWAKASESGSFEVNFTTGLPPERYFAALLLGIQWRGSCNPSRDGTALPVETSARDAPPPS